MTKKIKQQIILIAITVFALCLIGGCASSNNNDTDSNNISEKKELTILHTNDIHGGYSRIDAASGEENEDIIGYDRIKTKFDELSKAETTMLLDAGDALQGTYFVSENKGDSAVELMNAMPYDAMTLGNHEFDYGWFRLQELMGKIDFPILSQLPETDDSIDSDIKPYVTIKRDDIKVGVFGLTTPETQFTSDGGFAFDFGSKDALITHAKNMVEELTKKEKVDFIICLSHLGIVDSGYLTSYDIRDQVKGINVIIDGHSHTTLEDIDNAADKTLITSTGGGGYELGQVTLTKENGKTSTDAKILNADDFADIDADKTISALLNTWDEKVQKSGNEIVTTIPFGINVARENERTKETVMGNITTDAMREVSGAQIAFQNGGSIRDADLSAGDIKKSQLLTVFPYGNIIQMANVSGSVIMEALEHSVSLYPEENGGFLQVSGLSYTFNPQLDAGQRITKVLIGDTPLDESAIYTVATNDFTAYGGDEYTMLKEPFASQLPLANPELSALEEAVSQYFITHSAELKNETEGRIVIE